MQFCSKRVIFSCLNGVGQGWSSFAQSNKIFFVFNFFVKKLTMFA